MEPVNDSALYLFAQMRRLLVEHGAATFSGWFGKDAIGLQPHV